MIEARMIQIINLHRGEVDFHRDDCGVIVCQITFSDRRSSLHTHAGYGENLQKAFDDAYRQHKFAVEEYGIWDEFSPPLAPDDVPRF